MAVVVFQSGLAVPAHGPDLEARLQITLARPRTVVHRLFHVHHHVDQVLRAVALVLNDAPPLGHHARRRQLCAPAVLPRARRLIRDLPRVPHANLDASANLQKKIKPVTSL